jgi:hypothetical protein
MSIPKVAGLETEYGIVLLGTPSSDPFLASRLLLDAYLSPVQPDLASEITAEGEPVTALPSSTRRLFNRRADSSVKPGTLLHRSRASRILHGRMSFGAAASGRRQSWRAHCGSLPARC